MLEACTHAHVMHMRVGSVSAHDGQLHRRTDPAGQSADFCGSFWQLIATSHAHEYMQKLALTSHFCACVRALCLVCRMCPHARSACTEPPIAHDDCGHWAVFSILIIYISMPGLIPVA